VLSAQADEMIYALVYPDYEKEPDLAGRAQVIYDFGIVEPTERPELTPQVLPELALTNDELKPQPGGKALGSLVAYNGQPVQLPVQELIFTPRRPSEVSRFLAETKGEVIEQMSGGGQKSIYLVRVDPQIARQEALEPMLAFMGAERKLFASNEQVIDLLRLVLRLRFEGYLVAVNPRLHPNTVPSFVDDRPTQSEFTLEDFAVDRAWAFAEVFDYAERRVGAAFVDQGFAPNPDFRGYEDGSIHQCRRDGIHFECGPDFAVGIPGEGLFGASSWHGNGMVTVAGGVQNNRFGTSGVAGPVMEPMLYNMRGGMYVFDVASGLAQALADGASVVNFSSGFPCNLLNNIGIAPGICGPGEATRFCTLVVAGLAGAIELACVLCPFPITCAILCTVARATYLTAFGACISLVSLGEWRGPMLVQIDRATAAGVPVVASSGNRIRNLPSVLEAIVDMDDADAGHWQVVPCVLDHVICVGAAFTDRERTNQEFHGAVVDIWAPAHRMEYWAPPTVDAVVPPALQTMQRGSGTSPAAAYITGTIALLQALQPDLDRTRTERSGAALASIPDDLLAVMTSTAHAPHLERGLLVNPFAALEQVSFPAIGATLDDFSYDHRLNFTDTDGVTDLMLDHPVQVTDTIHFYSDSGSISIDADAYEAHLPAAEGMYRLELELRVPADFGTLAVTRLTAIDDTWIWASGGRELLRRFQLGEFFHSSVLDFEIRHGHVGAGLGLDNVYRIDARAVRVGNLPEADRFDVDDPALNPPESRPRNDIPPHAVHVGEIHAAAFPELGWPDCADCRDRIRIDGLNFDRPEDVDVFEITPPACLRLPGFRECNLRMDMESESWVEAQAYDALGNLLGWGINGIDFWTTDVLADPIYLHLRPGGGGRLVEYSLILEHSEWTRPHFPDPHLMQGPLWFGYPRLVPPRDCPECQGWLELNLDWLGRATDPDDYRIAWNGADTFRAFIQLEQGSSVSLTLATLQGDVLAQVSTPDLDQGAEFTFAGTHPGLLLEMPNLQQGDYLLQVSHAKPGSRFFMTMSSGAVHNGGLPLEDYLGMGSQSRPKQ
jgi:hypothetical protein